MYIFQPQGRMPPSLSLRLILQHRVMGGGTTEIEDVELPKRSLARLQGNSREKQTMRE